MTGEHAEIIGTDIVIYTRNRIFVYMSKYGIEFSHSEIYDGGPKDAKNDKRRID